jgi:hypothetical protein
MLDVTGRRDAVESSVIAPMRGRVAVIEAEADIRRSPEDVFDYASDPAHEPEWNIRMKRLEKLTDGPVSVGAGYRMEFTQGPPAISECVLRAPQPLGAGRRVEGNQLRLYGQNGAQQ